MTNLLLVEDDPIISEMIISDLKELFPFGQLNIVGHAESLRDAQLILESESPDLALLDISLGSNDDRSGIRIAEYINRSRPIPIIFLSGLPQGFDQAKYMLPVGYLRKPYKKQDLADQIELVLLRQTMTQLPLVQESVISGKLAGLPKTVFVTVNRGELEALPLDQLIMLEADGKVIKAFLDAKEFPIVFTSPGLKNFYEEHLAAFGNQFFQLSRKYVINLRKLRRIRDNHVILPRFSKNQRSINEFSIAFPANSDSKKYLIEILEGGVY